MRFTNLSKLPVNEMSETQILVEAQKTVNHQRTEKKKSQRNKAKREIDHQNSKGSSTESSKINYHA